MSALLHRYKYAAAKFQLAYVDALGDGDVKRATIFGVIAAHEELNGLGKDVAQMLRDEYDNPTEASRLA